MALVISVEGVKRLYGSRYCHTDIRRRFNILAGTRCQQCTSYHITDAANELANLPRKRRFMKAADKRGLDLIKDPREAAGVLMVAIARLNKEGRVTDDARATMTALFAENMGQSKSEAEDFIDNTRWLTRDLNQADSVLRPMVNVLRGTVNAGEADDLAHMLTKVAMADGEPNTDQVTFLKRYREYMGLNA